MHPVDPVRVQSLHSVHDGADGPLVGEDPDLGRYRHISLPRFSVTTGAGHRAG